VVAAVVNCPFDTSVVAEVVAAVAGGSSGRWKQWRMAAVAGGSSGGSIDGSSDGSSSGWQQ